MGGGTSKDSKWGSATHAATSEVDKRVISALQAAAASLRGSSGTDLGDARRHSVASFDRIVLRFPQLHSAFRVVHTVFKDFDLNGDGVIEHGELRNAIRRLHTHGLEDSAAAQRDLSEQEINDIFHESDVYKNGKLSFKEFVVALAVSHVLGVIPSLKEEKEEPSSSSSSAAASSAAAASASTPPKLELCHSASDFWGHGGQLRKALANIVDAYLWFDSDGTGVITRANMATTMKKMQANSPSKRSRKMSHGPSGGGAALGVVAGFLAEERWAEMDWNHDGTITFQEFTYAFVSWVLEAEDTFASGADDVDGGAVEFALGD